MTAELHVPPTVLRRRIAYWQSQGLLKEVSADTFLLVEEPSGRSTKNVAASDMMCEDDEAESIMASAQDQREEELQVRSYLSTDHQARATCRLFRIEGKCA